MEGARSILLSITGGSDISLWEVNEAAKAVAAAAHPDANIIFGAMLDEKLGDDQVWVTVIATGYRDRGTRPRTDERPGAQTRAREGRWQDRREQGWREPAGEPQVTRARDRPPSRDRAARFMDVEVPEFMPRR
jgi:cell division protein FtsZ